MLLLFPVTIRCFIFAPKVIVHLWTIYLSQLSIYDIISFFDDHFIVGKSTK